MPTCHALADSPAVAPARNYFATTHKLSFISVTAHDGTLVAWHQGCLPSVNM